MKKSSLYFFYLYQGPVYFNDATMILDLNLHVSFLGTYHLILPNPCVHTLMAVFHVIRNPRLYTVLSFTKDVNTK